MLNLFDYKIILEDWKNGMYECWKNGTLIIPIAIGIGGKMEKAKFGALPSALCA
jgi:hypothetical protein